MVEKDSTLPQLKPVLIYGIGQQAELAYYYFTHELGRRVDGFIIDREDHPAEIFGLSVFKLSQMTGVIQEGQVEVFIAIGSIGLNAIREHYLSMLQDLGAKIASCITNRTIPPTSSLGSINTFMDTTCALGPFTTLGKNLLLYNARISHHCQIGDNVSINAAMVGANCRIGRNSVIALSATIESGVTIGEYSLIDSGALVKEDTPPYSVVTAPSSRIRRVDARRVKIFGESLHGFQRRIGR